MVKFKLILMNVSENVNGILKVPVLWEVQGSPSSFFWVEDAVIAYGTAFRRITYVLKVNSQAPQAVPTLTRIYWSVQAAVSEPRRVWI
jgi:hypothetical protein